MFSMSVKLESTHLLQTSFFLSFLSLAPLVTWGKSTSIVRLTYITHHWPRPCWQKHGVCICRIRLLWGDLSCDVQTPHKGTLTRIHSMTSRYTSCEPSVCIDRWQHHTIGFLAMHTISAHSVCAFVVFAPCGEIWAVTCKLPTRVLWPV